MSECEEFNKELKKDNCGKCEKRKAKENVEETVKDDMKKNLMLEDVQDRDKWRHCHRLVDDEFRIVAKP